MHTDVIIIGSGQAGTPLATRLAHAGKTVVLAERSNFGGTCVNYGCTPTKAMVASARAAHVARTSARLGVHAGAVTVDFAAVVDRKDAIVRQFREGAARRLREAGPRLRVIRGHARFVGERAVEVNEERLTADTIIVNVGTRPALPDLPGLRDVPFLDNHRILELRALPAHLIVVGGGYIGCEFAQMFRRFGASVTIVHRGSHLLDRGDVDVSSVIERVFLDEGIRLELGAETQRVGLDRGEVVLRLGRDKELRGSHLLIATGRRPNTDDLGCDKAGIELDRRGNIVADDHYRTTAPGIHALADVLGDPQFTHVSWDDHRLLFDLLMGRGTRGRSGRHVPSTVFTDPPIASVGLTEREAKAKGIPYELATMPFASVARAIETGETAGVLRLLIDPRSEKVLGATLVGAEAGELIHIFVALMGADAPVRAFVDAQAVHPTYAEGVQTLVMSLPRFALS